MSYQARTDLAIEARELYVESGALEADLDGVETESADEGNGISLTRVRITNEKGEKLLGKPRGNYITIEMPSRFYGEQEIYEHMCRTCAKELKPLLDTKLTSDEDTVLVVGLGNWNITADALGPKVLDSLMVTRHLKEYIPEEIDEGVRPVCAVSPGVLGLTGVETGEIVRGITDRVKPALVIAIDALCSRKIERINTTIQIADTGITPGAGIGNERKALNEDTLGVPVIAIGVPTVVDAATIAGDSINMLLEHLKENAKENEGLYKMLSGIAEEDKYALIKQAITPSVGDFIVAPKEVDSVIRDIASVIANGINISVHRGIGLEDVNKYVF